MFVSHLEGEHPPPALHEIFPPTPCVWELEPETPYLTRKIHSAFRGEKVGPELLSENPAAEHFYLVRTT